MKKVTVTIEYDEKYLEENNIDLLSEIQGWLADSQMRIASVDEDATVWRITEDDFRSILINDYPELTDEQRESIIQKAYNKFSIYDWSEHVDAFISATVDEMQRK